MVGLAAFQAVLHRYTGQDNLLLGTPVANRNRGETEPLVGLFVNTVVLRTDLSGDPTFRDLLERVRKTRLGAFAHQDVSLEALIEELRPARDTSRQPFFQAAFYYQNVTIIPERFSRHRLQVLPVHNGTAMFDLRLVLEDGPFGGLWGWVEYNTDLFDAAHIKQLVGHFLTVTEAAAASPTTPISQLPLLPPAERQRIVADWNQTDGDYPAADGLPDAFARRAAATPDAPALVARGKTVTYGQLNDRANRLAHYLRSRGVKPRDLVGVCLKRSADMVAAVLAVTKCGAAYVPLDAELPEGPAGLHAGGHAGPAGPDPGGPRSTGCRPPPIGWSTWTRSTPTWPASRPPSRSAGTPRTPSPTSSTRPARPASRRASSSGTGRRSTPSTG